MIENCPMRHENGNCIPAGGFCTANKNICEALLNAYRMGKAQLSQEDTTSDTISRQAALNSPVTMVSEGLDWIPAYHIKELPSAQPEQLERCPIYDGVCGYPSDQCYDCPRHHGAQPEPQWIPVERELPEDFTDVLVWFEYFRYGDYNCLYQTHGIGTYVANYNLWTVNHETGWKDLRVIAWMPLPELYKPNK